MASGATSAGPVNHSDTAAAAAFHVEVNVMAEAAAATTAADEATRGPSVHESAAASVARTLLGAATTTLSTAVDLGHSTEGSRGRVEQLEQDVDKLMQKMGIHGNNNISKWSE